MLDNNNDDNNDVYNMADSSSVDVVRLVESGNWKSNDYQKHTQVDIELDKKSSFIHR